MTEMDDIDHTHPITNKPFGERIEPTTAVAVDGGEPSDGEPAEMKDVDHESPHDEGADRAFERGTEGQDETV